MVTRPAPRKTILNAFKRLERQFRGVVEAMEPPRDNFHAAVAHVLQNEGGLVDDPDDPGGVTNFGISQRAYPDINIRKLTAAMACRLYREDYWIEGGYDQIRNRALAIKVFDIAVNVGVRQANRLLQASVNAVRAGYIAVDGVLGPKTAAAIAECDPCELLLAFMSRTGSFYRGLKNKKYLAGWMNRLVSYHV